MAAVRFFLFCCLIIFLVSGTCFSQDSSDQELKITFLDLGYADAILVQPPGGETLLFDAGSKKRAGKVADFLKRNSIDSIEAAFITHGHENHFGGFLKLMQVTEIKKVYISPDTRGDPGYSELLDRLRENKIDIETVKKGSQIKNLPDGLEIRILHPEKTAKNINNNSLVIQIDFYQFKFLLVSDSSIETQEDIIKSLGPDLDLIEIGHHGFSIPGILIKDFKETVKIISSGVNPYGVLDENKISSLGVNVFRTDKHGDVVIITDGYSLEVNTEHGNNSKIYQ